MQTVASKSPLGWAVVHKIEGTKDFDTDVVDLNGEEVRKAEKELIAYNSESFAFKLSPIFLLFEVLFGLFCLALIFILCSTQGT